LNYYTDFIAINMHKVSSNMQKILLEVRM